ncbi:uncharacterized protein [Pempheris klunzingeri]|uniref:uncharacterized protein n=1 Tax=Pempheris klunzingeri TaxID=3127111 RepID=UPI00397FB4B1
MASAQASPIETTALEKHLMCTICMDLFVNPVTTTCGHSFCKECLDRNFKFNDMMCPLCKDHLRKTPDVNIVLRAIAEQLKNTPEKYNEDKYTGAPGEVACDICTELKLKAKKSCLVCLASYCSIHLENHSSTKRLKGHKLVEPVENLDERACLQHGRPLELYSRKREKCICVLCMEEGQDEVVSTEDEWSTKKAKLENTKTELQETVKKRKTRMSEIDASLTSCKDLIDDDWWDIEAVFTAVIAIVEEAQARALQPLKDRRQILEKEAKALKEELEAEIDMLEKAISGLDDISVLEDHVLFLQSYPSLPDLDNNKDWTEVELDTSLSFGTMTKTTTAMLKNVQLEVEKLTSIELKRIPKFSGVDGKEVKDGGEDKEMDDAPERFDIFGSVLGLNSLTSGKSYWEVEVNNRAGWDLGVARGDANRKGHLLLNPENGYWVTVHYDDDKYAVMTAPPLRLSLRDKPVKVGVFVDYEEGLVSFYDVTAQSQIYSFTEYTTYSSSDMSLQVCHCGWSKCTSYQGLRVHQGKMGCTPKGLRIPESGNLFWQNSGQITNISVKKENVPEPPNITTQMFPADTDATLLGMMKSLHSLRMASNPDKTCGALYFMSDAEPILMPMAQTFNTQMNPAAAEVKVKEENQSLFGTPQQCHETTTYLSKGHRALDFSTDAQQPILMPVAQTFSTQMNPAAAEVKVKEANQSLFGTPQQCHETTTYLSKGHRALDFSTDAQQPMVMPMAQTFNTKMNPAAAEVKVKEANQSLFGTPQQCHETTTYLHKARRALDFSTDAQQPMVMPMAQTFSTQMNPAAAEVKVKEANQSLFGTPQQCHETTTYLSKGHRTLDFSTDAQQPMVMPMAQTFNTKMNPAAAEVKVKEANQSLFGTPQQCHETTTYLHKARRALDFSTDAQQPILMPVAQTFSTQMNPAAAEVKVKEANQSLFGTPQQCHETTTYLSKGHRSIDFSTDAQQVGQLARELPTSTDQETIVRPKKKEKEKEREKEKEKEREAQKLVKAKQDRMRADLQLRVQMREHKMAEVRSSVKACKGSLDVEWLEINNVFSEVMRVVEDARQKALQPMEERRHRLKREGHDVIKKLQKEIDKLKKATDELDKNLDLQVSPLTDMDESQDWKNLTVDTSFSFGTLRSTTANMIQNIHHQLEKLSSVELKRIPTFAVDVKLDPATAHQCLVLSPDGKTVKDGGKNQKVPDAPERFDMFGSVLGLNRLTSGKSYWEVEVRNKTGWDLGVARRNAKRKGKLSLTPDNGYWATVHYEDKKYAALSSPPVSLSLTVKPQKVGVFVDYEEGLVSFYNVTTESHIYSFTECSFSGEIFPYFSPHLKQNEKNGDPLIISAVKKQ